jgi:hypothetical protein
LEVSNRIESRSSNTKENETQRESFNDAEHSEQRKLTCYFPSHHQKVGHDRTNRSSSNEGEEAVPIEPRVQKKEGSVANELD